MDNSEPGGGPYSSLKSLMGGELPTMDEVSSMKYVWKRECAFAAQALEVKLSDLEKAFAACPDAPWVQGAALNEARAYLAFEVIAAAPSTGARLLSRLVDIERVFGVSDSRVSDILVALAGNDRTPDEALTKLAQHGSPEVRRAVAGHPRLPLPDLQTLTQDSDPSVSHVAREASALRQEFEDAGARKVWLRVFRGAKTQVQGRVNTR